jgi:chromosome segregation ATPase
MPFFSSSSFLFNIGIGTKTAESKKEDFRRYLERSGAIDSLTSVLVGLYEETERPLESTDYIKKYLGASSGSHSSSDSVGDDAKQNHNASTSSQSHRPHQQQHLQQLQENDKLRKENKELRNQVKELNKTIETLRSNLKHSREEAKKARSQNQSLEQQQQHPS